MKKQFLLITLLTIFSLNCMQSDTGQLENQLQQLQTQLNYLKSLLPKIAPTPPAPAPAPPPPPPAPAPAPPAPRPATTPRPSRPVTKVDVPTIRFTPITIRALDTGTLQPLERMPSTIPLEKAKKKAQAKGILNGILAFIQSDKFNPQQHTEPIEDAVNRILAIDPLLISTAAIVLREAQVPINKNYQIMSDYYKSRIEYIAKEFGAIAKRRAAGQIHAGLREDIDEALSYPIELTGEIQKAKTIIELQPDTQEAQQAQAFIQRIDELREWLLALLKTNKTKLQDAGLPVDEYIKIIEKKEDRSYCALVRDKKYVPFIEDLQKISKDIQEYEQKEASYLRSQKIYKQQSIINTLRGFLDHATARGYCKICLWEDIQVIKKADQQGTFNLDQIFKQIESFLRKIYSEEENEAVRVAFEDTVPKLREAVDRLMRITFNQVSALCD